MSKDYQIFQIRCSAEDCKVIYDVRTFYKGKPTNCFPCNGEPFEEKYSDGYCPDCLGPLLDEIERYKIKDTIESILSVPKNTPLKD